MNRERRWYWAIQVLLVGGFITILTVLWTTVLKQTRLFTSVNDCGCTIPPAQWPLGVMIGTWLVVAAATVLTVRFVIALISRARKHQRILRAYRGRGREIIHHPTGLRYLLIQDHERQAMTLGLLQPVIVVTTGLVAKLSGSELASVLRHENAHVRGRDGIGALVLEAIGQTFGWVGGLRTYINTAFVLREVLADAAATKGYTQLRGLSGAMVKLATAASPRAIPEFSPNNDRINKLLNRDWPVPLPRLHWSPVVIGLALAIGLVVVDRLPAATAATQPVLPAEACWIRQLMCTGEPTEPVIFMSPTGVMSRYDW